MSATLDPGAAFGAYRIDAMIGRGGMGVVYRAYDESLERPVALKLVAPDLADDERFRRRFLREPKLAAALDHPNVIPIYAAGEQDGQLYLAMRYVEGSDLGTVLADAGTIAPDRALHILGQVAAALDAAHRRDLVHRDVKPANILLDADDHAYLTDFGVSKRVGGHTTETEGLVGTLDYLAPEQIRGGSVNGQADEYALACMLYECLSGTPPFWRETKAEAMWAHLNDEPPPLSASLDPVLRRGLAKAPEDRYATCGELVAAAAAILRQDAAPTSAPRPWPRLHGSARNVRALLAAGGALLAAAAIAAALLAGGDGERAPALLGADAVGEVDPATGRLVAVVPVPGSPDRLAAARGAVWTLGDDSAMVSAIDVRKRAVSSAIAPGGVPGDVAAGEGALWTVDVRGARLIKLSPAYGSVVRRIRLRPPPSTGLPTVSALSPWSIAAGGGAVWLTDGSSRLTRVDPRTRRLSRIDLHLPLNGVTVYAGKVWAISGRGASVLRVDPRRREPPDRIPIAGRPGDASPYPISIEGGLGAVWVLNGNTATVTRIDPHQLAPTATAAIGVDRVPARLAVGVGAVWVADTDGTLARIDPATNTVRATTVGHGLNDVAVAGGAVWVSGFGGNGSRLAGGEASRSAASSPGIRALAPAMCSPLYFRPGDRPRLLITSDFPLQTTQAIEMTDAIQFVLRERRFQAGRYSIAYQSCDDSTQSNSSAGRCAANARAYARNPSVVGVIGTFISSCATLEVPILNRAPRGPLAMISPANTYVGLTRAGPGAAVGDPARYAPTGRRSYVRIVAPDDTQAAADAQLAKQLGVRRAYVLDDGGVYGAGLAAGFRAAAARLGIRVTGHATWGMHPRRLVRRVRAAHPEAVFLGGGLLPDAPGVVTELRRRLPRSVKLLAADGFFVTPWLVRFTGRAAEGMYVSHAGLPLEKFPGPGADFVARFGAAIGERPQTNSVYAAQATQILLDAIARSDGTRTSVLHQLFATHVRNGLLGSFAITPEGDTTARTITTYRVTRGAFRVWRVITPPAKLPSASPGHAGPP